MGRANPTLLIASFFFLLLCEAINPSFASAVTDPLDVSALEALYGSLNAPPQLIGWKATGGDPCGEEQWRGVSCSGQSVVSIKIKGLGVGGCLGSQLSTFLSLKELDLSKNNISGEIPLGLPPNATYINLAENIFSQNIPFSLSSLRFLEHLNLSHNALFGPVGNVFTDMQNLEILDLSFNHFTGDLPSSFSSLTNLHALYLQDNEFTGSVSFLANLPLSILYLENNHFSGYLPKQFEFIHQLRISGNLFQGGYAFPQPLRNRNSHSPVSSADRNVSHRPKVTPSSFSFSSIQGGHNQKRVGLGVMAGAIGGLVLVALLAAVVLVNSRRAHKSDLDSSKSITDFFHVLPVTTSSVPEVNLDQCPWVSAHMTATRPPSVHHPRPHRMSKRKSSLRRSRNLLTAKLYSASEILTATNNYSEENLLGEGLIGHVYKAEFPDGQMLAVKKIDLVALAVYEEDEFLDVVWNMSRLRHRNIAKLLGYSVEHGEHVLVYEYACSGSLHDVLFSANNMHKALSWKARVRIALGVAHALEYMHWICSPPMAHGNIKATNILLDDELMPHISDCGLTVLRHLISTKPKASELSMGFNGYTAPELCIPGVDKTKTDVYGFGVVLLELLTGKRAFDSSRSKEEQYLVKWASSRLHDFSSLEGMTDPTIKGTIPSKALSQFADIILLCIQPEPEFRPPMTGITEYLIRLVHKMADHTKLRSAEASELDVSDISFKSTLAYLEPPSSPVST
ncbi:protein STRUBBELIG-RECEPTOR FAMILY 8 [Elaeis guineensis]|uniref:Protein STRUBBELIG-RECEPTOR FAMILY 8 isoform X1 n=1 Tax=Elaeis guineensis var. tenera TaxID=51953 RepID=A0A8N4F060_ELAGV|nr:protein STRUBBELIG-RECEPTOR FAMILY 8 isoform X1 [Elaeis guineensis]